jgi:hypothetical protein
VALFNDDGVAADIAASKLPITSQLYKAGERREKKK